jgi:hypothetical protein
MSDALKSEGGDMSMFVKESGCVGQGNFRKMLNLPELPLEWDIADIEDTLMNVLQKIKTGVDVSGQDLTSLFEWISGSLETSLRKMQKDRLDISAKFPSKKIDFFMNHPLLFKEIFKSNTSDKDGMALREQWVVAKDRANGRF